MKYSNKKLFVLLKRNDNQISSFYTDKEDILFSSDLRYAKIYTHKEDAKYDSYMLKRIGNYTTQLLTITEENLYNL